jgi:hypothetical protein
MMAAALRTPGSCLFDKQIYNVYAFSEWRSFSFTKASASYGIRKGRQGIISKHGAGFETACQVFFDPFVRVEDASVAEEKREASHVTRERDDSHYFSAVRDAIGTEVL